MSQEKHPFDAAAERLEALRDAPVAERVFSPDFWELRCAADAEVVGDYPQALLPEDFDRGETDGLGPDGFPAGPFPVLELQSTARWTDVLSSSLWSEGMLFAPKARAVFEHCDLGNYRAYPVVVRDAGGSERSYTYLHVRNIVPPTAFDFGKSEFRLEDMIGMPQGPVTIVSFEDWQEKQRLASAGKLNGCERFSRIAYSRLLLRPEFRPRVDLFRLERLGTGTYITARLKEALEDSGTTGLEIRPNRRLYAP